MVHNWSGTIVSLHVESFPSARATVQEPQLRTALLVHTSWNTPVSRSGPLCHYLPLFLNKLYQSTFINCLMLEKMDKKLVICSNALAPLMQSNPGTLSLVMTTMNAMNTIQHSLKVRSA